MACSFQELPLFINIIVLVVATIRTDAHMPAFHIYYSNNPHGNSIIKSPGVYRAQKFVMME